jgi:hypothetical protein
MNEKIKGKWTDGFEKANSIELHDSGIVISQHDSRGEGFYGWSDQCPGGYFIEGSTIRDFVKFFDIPFYPIENFNRITKKLVSGHLQDQEFKIHKFRKDLNAEQGTKIMELWAKVKNPNLLQFWFLADFGAKAGSSYQAVAYSGNFTIWWDEDIRGGD